MKQYVIRRLLIGIFVLFGVSVILYSLVRLMPGDYVQNATAGNPKITEEMRENMRRVYGLDTGIVEGYVKWMGKAVTGDFGNSFVYDKPVVDVITSKMWNSFALSAMAFVIQILLAIPLGIISATKQYSKLDYTLTTFAMLGISMPSFFLAAILQRFFAIGLKWFPLSGMVTAREDFEGFRHLLDVSWHYVLPVVVLAVISTGALMRYTRTNMLEVLNADYIRTARAKGLSEHKVIYTHAFRNTLIPIVTLVGGMLPSLFSGSMITETIFAIDGIGNTAYNCLKQGDIPLVMGFNMFLAILTLLGTLISDILYAVVDPRVRYN